MRVTTLGQVQPVPGLGSADARVMLDRPGLRVVHVSLPAGAGLPRHAGADAAAFYVIEGTVRLSVGGESAHAGPGTLSFAPAGPEREARNDSDKPARLLVIRVPQPCTTETSPTEAHQ